MRFCTTQLFLEIKNRLVQGHAVCKKGHINIFKASLDIYNIYIYSIRILSIVKFSFLYAKFIQTE